jgi:hypothetical protein
VTVERATDIFIEHYFEPPDRGLPEVLQAGVFDMYVNAGSNAVRILQRLLRRMGHDLVGGRDHRAADDPRRPCSGTGRPAHLADAYGIARRNYYYRLADRRPASRKYARRRDGGKGGWIKRAEDFITPRYHLSAAEHRERVSGWD